MPRLASLTVGIALLGGACANTPAPPAPAAGSVPALAAARALGPSGAIDRTLVSTSLFGGDPRHLLAVAAGFADTLTALPTLCADPASEVPLSPQRGLTVIVASGRVHLTALAATADAVRPIPPCSRRTPSAASQPSRSPPPREPGSPVPQDS